MRFSDQVYATELVLGGQKSGKSKRAEQIARLWLNQSHRHCARWLVTAQAFDAEMQSRIERHRAVRKTVLPEAFTHEEPIEIGKRIAEYSDPDTIIVIDCLTVWLTNLLMPHPQFAAPQTIDAVHEIDVLFQSLQTAKGPVVLVSNEIGLGVIPLGSETRHFVDELGRLNQSVAERCQAVTLMVAGLMMDVKRPA